MKTIKTPTVLYRYDADYKLTRWTATEESTFTSRGTTGLWRAEGSNPNNVFYGWSTQKRAALEAIKKIEVHVHSLNHKAKRLKSKHRLR